MVGDEAADFGAVGTVEGEDRVGWHAVRPAERRVLRERVDGVVGEAAAARHADEALEAAGQHRAGQAVLDQHLAEASESMLRVDTDREQVQARTFLHVLLNKSMAEVVRLHIKMRTPQHLIKPEHRISTHSQLQRQVPVQELSAQRAEPR
eukprot:2186736-Rhodomonas_salina.1